MPPSQPIQPVAPEQNRQRGIFGAWGLRMADRLGMGRSRMQNQGLQINLLRPKRRVGFLERLLSGGSKITGHSAIQRESEPHLADDTIDANPGIGQPRLTDEACESEIQKISPAVFRTMKSLLNKDHLSAVAGLATAIKVDIANREDLDPNIKIDLINYLDRLIKSIQTTESLPAAGETDYAASVVELPTRPTQPQPAAALDPKQQQKLPDAAERTRNALEGIVQARQRADWAGQSIPDNLSNLAIKRARSAVMLALVQLYPTGPRYNDAMREKYEAAKKEIWDMTEPYLNTPTPPAPVALPTAGGTDYTASVDDLSARPTLRGEEIADSLGTSPETRKMEALEAANNAFKKFKTTTEKADREFRDLKQARGADLGDITRRANPDIINDGLTALSAVLTARPLLSDTDPEAAEIDRKYGTIKRELTYMITLIRLEHQDLLGDYRQKTKDEKKEALVAMIAKLQEGIRIQNIISGPVNPGDGPDEKLVWLSQNLVFAEKELEKLNKKGLGRRGALAAWGLIKNEGSGWKKAIKDAGELFADDYVAPNTIVVQIEAEERKSLDKLRNRLSGAKIKLNQLGIVGAVDRYNDLPVTMKVAVTASIALLTSGYSAIPMGSMQSLLSTRRAYKTEVEKLKGEDNEPIGLKKAAIFSKILSKGIFFATLSGVFSYEVGQLRSGNLKDAFDLIKDRVAEYMPGAVKDSVRQVATVAADKATPAIEAASKATRAASGAAPTDTAASAARPVTAPASAGATSAGTGSATPPAGTGTAAAGAPAAPAAPTPTPAVVPAVIATPTLPTDFPISPGDTLEELMKNNLPILKGLTPEQQNNVIYNFFEISKGKEWMKENGIINIDRIFTDRTLDLRSLNEYIKNATFTDRNGYIVTLLQKAGVPS